MSVAFEPHVGARFIRAKIIANSALVARVGTRVYQDEVPPSADATPPYIIMSMVDANDLTAVGAIRIWSNQLWQVEVWNRTTQDEVAASDAALLNTALDRTSGTMTGPAYGSGIVFSAVRERSLKLPPEQDGDVRWMRAGGEFRLQVQGATS